MFIATPISIHFKPRRGDMLDMPLLMELEIMK